jgi:hypothetical protein
MCKHVALILFIYLKNVLFMSYDWMIALCLEGTPAVKQLVICSNEMGEQRFQQQFFFSLTLFFCNRSEGNNQVQKSLPNSFAVGPHLYSSAIKPCQSLRFASF